MNVDTSYLGGFASYLIDVRGTAIRAVAPAAGHTYRRGQAVCVRFTPDDCVLLRG